MGRAPRWRGGGSAAQPSVARVSAGSASIEAEQHLAAAGADVEGRGGAGQGPPGRGRRTTTAGRRSRSTLRTPRSPSPVGRELAPLASSPRSMGDRAGCRGWTIEEPTVDDADELGRVHVEIGTGIAGLMAPDVSRRSRRRRRSPRSWRSRLEPTRCPGSLQAGGRATSEGIVGLHRPRAHPASTMPRPTSSSTRSTSCLAPMGQASPTTCSKRPSATGRRTSG